MIFTISIPKIWNLYDVVLGVGRKGREGKKGTKGDGEKQRRFLLFLRYKTYISSFSLQNQEYVTLSYTELVCKVSGNQD